jgi:predicted lipase
LKKILDHWFTRLGSRRIQRGPQHKDDVVRTQVVNLLCKSERMPRRTEDATMDAVMVSIDYCGSLVLAFRGTETIENVLTNTKTNLVAINANIATGVSVHRGFQMHHRTLMKAVVDEITRYVHNGGNDVIFTGHSLGASACLMSAFACAIDPVISDFMKHVRVRCITFGSPRIGTRDFSEWSDDLVPDTIRVVNGGDIVTKLPRHMYHVERVVELANAKAPPCLKCHKLENYIVGLIKKLPGILVAQVEDCACRTRQSAGKVSPD